MIRINLGKNELEQSGSRRKWAGALKLLPLGVPSKKKNNFITVLFIVLAVAIAILPQMFFRQYSTFIRSQHEGQVKIKKQKMAALDMDINRFTSFQTELQSYEQQKKLVSDRLAVVRELLSLRGTPVSILDTISQSLPKRTWLKNVDFVMTPGKANIIIQGQSFSHSEVSEYVERLTESVHVADVALEDVSTAKLGEEKIDVKSFQVVAKPKTQAMLASGLSPDMAPPSNTPGAAKKPPDAVAKDGPKGRSGEGGL